MKHSIISKITIIFVIAFALVYATYTTRYKNKCEKSYNGLVVRFQSRGTRELLAVLQVFPILEGDFNEYNR